uniref:exodeoxyribonuclease III n=1 Tax=Salarias fasciatus TaxID=181472 RepID=A0A672HWV1_SALFA
SAECPLFVTGFTVRDGKLFCHEDLKATTPLLEALQSFIAFLSSFRRPVLLVGHNARSFDAPILSRVLTQSSLLEPFREAASGTLDTLPVSRELFPDLQNHRQEFLVRRFLNKQYGAHNAVEDAKVLQELFKHWDIQDQTSKVCPLISITGVSNLVISQKQRKELSQENEKENYRQAC